MDYNDNPDVGGLLGHQYRHKLRPNIPVPSKLDVHARNIEVAWRKFQRQWNNYEVATRLDTESPKYRTSVLLACIDDEAFDIFDGFSFEKEDQNDIDIVLDKFELAKTCNFKTNEERMLRDRIVLGVRDDTVRQKLLEDRKLTLASCIEVCRAHESSHLQAKAIMSGTQCATAGLESLLNIKPGFTEMSVM